MEFWARADHDMQQQLDDYLRQAERERRSKASFNRAASEEKQRYPLARAFDKAAQQREHGQQYALARQDGRDRHRGDI